MNRRDFLKCCLSYTLPITLANLSTPLNPQRTRADEKTPRRAFRVMDAHAHPDRLLPPGRSASWIDKSSSLEAIKALGMAASAFAAVGDQVARSQGRIKGSEFENTLAQLEWWMKELVRPGKVKLVLKSSDIPEGSDLNRPPGAILAIEGGDPLEGRPDRVEEFYRLGVRMITLVHYRNNELGDIMRPWRLDPGPMHHGLTPAGRKVVERMQALGILVDVAHAHSKTLAQVAEMTAKPLIDSHTSPCALTDPGKCRRFRTWQDMELVARTGGVICTWPLAYEKPGLGVRKTFHDWAREIREMKTRLGMDHVGLGTDGGGHLPRLIEGYRDVRDLVHLIRAMEEIGFSTEEIGAYMGGNFFRVLSASIG